MDELLAQLKEKTGLPVDQIQSVVDGVFDFMNEKLPGNAGDQIKGLLETGGSAAGGMMDQAKGLLGGLMGGDK